jgi:hypothetical protein
MSAARDTDCDGIVAFEEKFGELVTSDLIQRICEEAYSEGSQYGVQLSVENLDREGLNKLLEGSVEHEGLWYDFTIRDGNWNGTEIQFFGFDDPTEGDHYEFASLLEGSLEAYLDANPAVRQAAGAFMATLRQRVQPSRISSASKQTHCLLRALMGDVAIAAQDYAEDAHQLANRTLTSRDAAEHLFAYLSPELQRTVEQVCTGNGFRNPAEFLAAGLAPVLAAAYFN